MENKNNFLEVEERRLCQKYNCKNIKEVLIKEKKILSEKIERGKI